jgi:hypothetical protein
MLFMNNAIVQLSCGIALGIASLTVAAEAQQLPTTAPAAQATSTQPAGQAAIVVDAAEHDFGQVRAGEKVEHSMTEDLR